MLDAMHNFAFPGSNETFLRQCSDSPQAILRRRVNVIKALGIAHFGGGFKHAATRQNDGRLVLNRSFAGVYDFAENLNYRDVFERFLSVPVPQLLVMCHPGISDPELAQRDGVTAMRDRELAFFESDDFAEVLSRCGWALAKFSTLVRET